MERMRNEQVVEKFIDSINGEYKSFNGNLKSVCGASCTLRNYGVVIAFFNSAGVICINEKYWHYSQTTQTILNKLIRLTNERLGYTPRVCEY